MNCLTACVERPLPDQPVPFLPQKIVHYRDHEQCLAHQGLFVERAALHPPAFSFIGKPFRSCLCQFLCDSPVRSLSIAHCVPLAALPRSDEHTSELQSLMRISYAVFCLTKTTN